MIVPEKLSKLQKWTLTDVFFMAIFYLSNSSTITNHKVQPTFI